MDRRFFGRLFFFVKNLIKALALLLIKLTARVMFCTLKGVLNPIKIR